jgi:hypothetical protein
MIYLASGLSKLQGSSWWTGDAPWLTMANYEFSPMYIGSYLAALRYLAEHRLLYSITMNAGTWFTLGLEIGFPFLVWHRHTRWVMIVMAVILHLNIAIFMGLVTFSMMMLVLVLSFVPPEAVHRMIGRLWQPQPDLRLAA